MNQYEIDKERFIELFWKFTGVGKAKLKNYLEENKIRHIFEHPTTLTLNIKQLEKIDQLKELRGLYFNLKSPKQEYEFNSPRMASNYYRHYLMGYKEKEKFLCTFLDIKNKVIATKEISTGTVNLAYVIPREVAKEALKYDASSITLCHNHPSGDVQPSKADIMTTKNISNALSTLNIKVKDHIIVSDYNYLSFAEKGLIEVEKTQEKRVASAREKRRSYGRELTR